MAAPRAINPNSRIFGFGERWLKFQNHCSDPFSYFGGGISADVVRADQQRDCTWLDTLSFSILQPKQNALRCIASDTKVGEFQTAKNFLADRYSSESTIFISPKSVMESPIKKTFPVRFGQLICLPFQNENRPLTENLGIRTAAKTNTPCSKSITDESI